MDKTTTPMGIGPLGSERVFPRTFRFLFISKNKPEMQHFTSKVKFSYINKSIEMAIYERVTLQGHDWIVEMMKEDHRDDFTLIALDGCGNKIYVVDFTGVKLTGHSLEYDYSNSDVVQHKLNLEYTDMIRTFSLTKESCAWDLDPKIGGEKPAE